MHILTSAMFHHFQKWI